MLNFETRGERGHQPPPSYRELVTDSAAAADRVHDACPACGYRWARSRASVEPVLELAPVGLPDRTEEEREQRRRHLEPTATRIAELLARSTLTESTLAVWLGPLVLDDATSDTLFIAAPPPTATWVADRYMPLLMQAAEILAGRAMCVQIYPADRPGALTIGELMPATTAAETAA